MEDQNGKIESRKKEVKLQFDAIEQERLTLVKERNELTARVSEIDRRLSEIVTFQTELRGRYAELEALLPDKKEVKEVIPTKKKKEN